MIPIVITSDRIEFPVTRKYDPESKVRDIKQKLELITGDNHETMSIDLYINGKFIRAVDQDDQKLSYYLEGHLTDLGGDICIKLHLKDNSNDKDEFNDVSKVEKFTLPEDQYEQRSDTARNFIKQLKAKKPEDGVST